MAKYIVNAREVWCYMVEIEADSKSDAKEAVSQGEGKNLHDTLEYSHTMDPEYWSIEKVDD